MSLLVIFSLELTPASSLGKIRFSQIPTIPAKDPTPIRLYTLPEVQTESGFPLCQGYRQNQALYSARGGGVQLSALSQWLSRYRACHAIMKTRVWISRTHKQKLDVKSGMVAHAFIPST